MQCDMIEKLLLCSLSLKVGKAPAAAKGQQSAVGNATAAAKGLQETDFKAPAAAKGHKEAVGKATAAAKGHQAAVGKVTAVRADTTCQPRPNWNPVFGASRATPSLDTSAASARYTFT